MGHISPRSSKAKWRQIGWDFSGTLVVNLAENPAFRAGLPTKTGDFTVEIAGFLLRNDFFFSFQISLPATHHIINQPLPFLSIRQASCEPKGGAIPTADGTCHGTGEPRLYAQSGLVVVEINGWGWLMVGTG